MDKSAFDQLWDSQILPWLQEKEAERRAAISAFWTFAGGGVGLAIVITILIGMINEELGGFVIIPAAIGIIGVAIGVSRIRKLRKEIKRELLTSIAGAAGMEYQLKPGQPSRFGAFRDFGLLPSDNRRSFEDGFSGRIGAADFDLCEAHLEQRRRSKNRTYYVTVFRGVLIRINFPRKVEGVTVITRDQGWFNGLAAFGRSFGSNKLERIGLVDPKFEKIFEVYGDDQVMARYMLTPSFMERLLELEAALDGKKVRGAFDAGLGEGELLIAAETGNRFEPGTMFKPLTDKDRFEKILDELRLVTEIIDLLCKPSEFEGPPSGEQPAETPGA